MTTTRPLARFGLALLMTAGLGALSAFAGQAGSLDTSFGGGTDDGVPDGMVSTWLGAGDDVANAIVTQPDGKVIVVGNHGNGQSTDMMIARYNRDGALDESFGTGNGTPKGVVALSLGETDDYAAGAVVQPDGKIVIGGYHMSGNDTNMVAVRLNADGSPDTGFGKGAAGRSDGLVDITLGKGNGNEDVRAIALDAEGRIVLAGNALDSQGHINMVVVRLNPDGSPDKSFAKGGGTPDGFTAVELGTGVDELTDMALAADGKIVLVGTHGLKGKTTMSVVRLNADGSLDQSFGTADDGTPNGVVSLSLGSGSDVARGLAIDPKGRIVVVGSSPGADGTTDVIVARLKDDGSLDEDFAVAEDEAPRGIMRVNRPGNANATDVVLDSRGNIIVAGFHEEAGQTKVTVLRFNDDGTLDQSFGEAHAQTAQGGVTEFFAAGKDIGAGITLAGDKLTLVGGGTTGATGRRNIMLMRMLAN